MTDLSKEILQNWLVRKSKAQKTRFIEFMQSRLPGLRIEEGGLFRSRNLVLGDPERADVVFTAHYDTCVRLPVPNFIAPYRFFLSMGYGVLIFLPVFLVGFLLTFLLVFLGVPIPLATNLGTLAFFVATLYILILGPANTHTVNDNTSGVLTLCELIAALSEEDRARCAFVFFDHEESGLFGSMFFASKHKKAMKNRLLINFDCVSDGDDLLLLHRGRSPELCGGILEKAFVSGDGKTVHITKPRGAYYPSDQVNFPCAVAVAAMKKKPRLGLYLDRIHTEKDTVMDETNLDFLCRGTQRFLALYQPNKEQVS